MKGVHTVAKSNHEGIVQIIDEFKKWNPAANNWFSNKTQRKACEDIIKYIGLEVALQAIPFLPQTNEMEFVPTVTTPLQLLDKYSSLKAQLIKKQDKTYEI